MVESLLYNSICFKTWPVGVLALQLVSVLMGRFLLSVDVRFIDDNVTVCLKTSC